MVHCVSLQTVLWVGTNLTSIKAIKQWRTTRLRACVEAKGGHFEHEL